MSSPRMPRRPMTIVLIVVVALTLVCVIVAMLLTLSGGSLPSVQQCEQNPNLLGC